MRLQNPYLPGGCSHHWWQKGYQAGGMDPVPDEDHARRRYQEGREASCHNAELAAKAALKSMGMTEDEIAGRG